MQTSIGTQPSPGAQQAAVSANEIRQKVIAATAEVHACTPDELEQEITRLGGDFRVKSVPAHSVLAALQGALGRSLPNPSKLKPIQYTSVNALIELVQSALRVN